MRVHFSCSSLISSSISFTRSIFCPMAFFKFMIKIGIKGITFTLGPNTLSPLTFTISKDNKFTKMRENVLLSKSRGSLTARKSIQALINYAQEQDKKFISRRLMRGHTSVVMPLLIVAPIVFSTIFYFAVTWQEIHPGGIFNVFTTTTKRPLTSKYAPEIYVKETAELRARALNKLDNDAIKLWT